MVYQSPLIMLRNFSNNLNVECSICNFKCIVRLYMDISNCAAGFSLRLLYQKSKIEKAFKCVTRSGGKIRKILGCWN